MLHGSAPNAKALQRSNIDAFRAILFIWLELRKAIAVFDIETLTNKVNRLLEEDTAASVTYAALECRLAIERACYIRLQIAHDYISQKDLAGWQPQKVIETLLREVDGNIASSLTLSMSPEPARDASSPLSVEEAEKIEWIEIGTQSALDYKRLSSLWYSLSNLALHTRLPAEKGDPIPDYGDKQKIREKVTEAIEELKRIAEGNLLASGIGKEVSFTCECGRLNKRRIDYLKAGQIVRCVGPECDESYVVSIEVDGIGFTRRLIDLKCTCGKHLWVVMSRAEKLRRDGGIGDIKCECGRKHRLTWRLQHDEG
jgi:hypothetical protein